MEDLSYLRTEYGRNKMIESYAREAKERELAEGNLTKGGSKNGSTNVRGTQSFSAEQGCDCKNVGSSN